MGLKNIELFDLYTGKILAKLYENFPLKIEVDVCDMLKLEIDQQNMTVPKECEIFNDTMEWLKESGFIYYEEKGMYSFHRVVLSAVGLETLKATPSSIKERDGIGEKIRDAVIRGKNEAIRTGVRLALSHALTKSIGM